MLRSLTLDSKRDHLIESSGTGLYVRDAQTGKVLQQVKGTPWLGDVAYRGDDRLVVANSRNTSILSPETLQVEKTLGVTGMLTRDGSHVLVWKETGLQRISTSTGQVAGESLEGYPYAFSEDGRYAFKDHTLINFQTGQPIQEIKASPEAAQTCGDTHNFPVFTSVNAAQHVMLVAFQHKEVQVWNTETWTRVYAAQVLGCDSFGTVVQLEEDDLHYLTGTTFGSINIKTNASTQRSLQEGYPIHVLFHNGIWWSGSPGHLEANAATNLKWQENDPEHWTVPDQTINLQLKATYQDQNHYRFEGTLQLGGQDLLVRNGLVTGSMVEFKQSRPHEMVIQADLLGQDQEWVGLMGARLLLEGSDALKPSYDLGLLLNGAYYDLTIERKK
ncbi:YncE family protein [Deinococcus roseus]|nr:hypothetical protein [Deinococcus roseus]